MRVGGCIKKSILGTKITNEVRLVAYATVSNLFATFHNPKMRGENFSWDSFPDVAERITATQVFLNVVCSSRSLQQNAEELGKKTAREIAIELIRQMQE